VLKRNPAPPRSIRREETVAADCTMTRGQQLRAARRFLGLSHPVENDEITAALRYIEFRDRIFRATKKRYSKKTKRAARSLALSLLRAKEAGVPMPADCESLIGLYQNPISSSARPKRTDGFKQRLALQQAFWLLSARNRPCMASRNGDWCKLAAILLGYRKPTASLLSQARQLRILFGLKRGQNQPGLEPGQN
jgi:hypothetical protein